MYDRPVVIPQMKDSKTPFDMTRAIIIPEQREKARKMYRAVLHRRQLTEMDQPILKLDRLTRTCTRKGKLNSDAAVQKCSPFHVFNAPE